MILWLTSYPKSGNTWVRAFLGNYLGANLGNSIDNIGKIKSFPKKKQFENNVDEKILKGDGFEIFKYFIAAQNIINKNNKFHIIKTHNFHGSVKNSEFSNKKNTAGLIYIVRDPRSVAVSYAYHEDISFEQSIDQMLNENRIATNDKFYFEARSSWRGHLLSWLGSPYPKLLIKYEDLKKDPFHNFELILKFINQFLDKKIDINSEKIEKIIKISSFESLSQLENEIGFKEKLGKTNFFRKGDIDEWKNVLSKEMIKKIEEKFNKEMKELNYLS